jgi:hypothetical protein
MASCCLKTDATDILCDLVATVTLPDRCEGSGLQELHRLLRQVRPAHEKGLRLQGCAMVSDEQVGLDGCEENIDTIVEWLAEEAANRGLPFLNTVGRLLVKRAIHNARKATPH